MNNPCKTCDKHCQTTCQCFMDYVLGDTVESVDEQCKEPIVAFHFGRNAEPKKVAI